MWFIFFYFKTSHFPKIPRFTESICLSALLYGMHTNNDVCVDLWLIENNYESNHEKFE